ncbi:MAG TPA: aminotransferase class I/II-fold pyridoxal phosphate-dependent enzyme [Stellaceae bacterium]
MTLKIARRGQVPPFIAMDVLRAANERAAAGDDVLHLEVGQPSTPAPAAVLAAARAALGRETLGYTDALGLPALREAIAVHYRLSYGVTLDPSRVVVTTGSSGAFLLAFLAAFEPGDRVAMAAPAYPAYRNILSALDLVPVELTAEPENRYQATLDLLRAQGSGLDGLIVASPANPTGTMLAPDELGAIARYCRDMGIRLVSDEIYHGIVYSMTAATALSTNDEAFVVNSFSKYFSMTGWRLGWMVAPAGMLRTIECLAQNLFISPPALSQHAALAAFGCRDELDANVARYARNRALLLDELPKAGLARFAPADGAFYLYADVAHLTNDSPEFCRRMLREIGVACTPGIDFDPVRGNATLRLSFAGTTDTMAEAARRLKAWRR